MSGTGTHRPGTDFPHLLTAAPLVAVLLLGVSACGASPTTAAPSGSTGAAASASHPWDGLTGAKREQALLAQAKKEGELSVYSGYNDEQSMADAFTKKYGIAVHVYSANSESVLQRINQEGSAGKSANDVVVDPSPDMQAIQSQGLLGTYTSEYRDAIPEKGKGKQWTGVRRLAFVAGWNTDHLKTGDVPADYSGFADPSWKGRISMELSDVDWYATVKQYYLDHGKSEQDVDAMFEAIAQNSKVAKGHTVQGSLLAAGQFDVALSVYTQTVERLEAKSAPVTYGADQHAIVEPVVVRYDAGGLMKSASHPAAATLYLDFELSQAGFAVDKSLGALPPIVQDGERLGDATVAELDTPAFVEHRSELEKEYEQLVRRGTQVGG